MDRLKGSAWRIALPYLVVGSLWIVASDRLLAWLAPTGLLPGQTLKGFLFVSATAALIYLLTARELRARRAAAEQLLELERRLAATERFEAMGQLTGGIAHDFNNLLTAISGHLDSCLALPEATGTLAFELKEARRSARRGAELTSQLLAVGRGQVLRPASIYLGDVISGMTTMLKRLLGEAIEIRVDLDGCSWPVLVDRGGLEQVLLNLAINARDAMPGGGRLTFRAIDQIVDEKTGVGFGFPFLPGDYVRLDVIDTGVGMDEATQSRIFEPFFTTKPKGVGTGLGLASAYGILKQSGGYITVRSEPGAGATFSIYLARATSAEEPAAACDEQEEPPPGGTETLLLVDDDQAVRSFATRALRREGYRVIQATGAREAMDLLRASRGRIHMLITDASMPGMTGPQLIQSARAEGSPPRALLISGHPQPGRDDDIPYLAKPFTAIELARRVRQVLDA